MKTETCPSPQTLQQLLLGNLPLGERDALEEHLLTCDRCVANAETISTDDDLTRLARQATPRPDGQSDVLNALIARIKTARKESETLKLEETVAGQLPHETPSPTLGGSTQPLDFLAPPQADGELGRLGEYRVLEVLGMGGMGVVLKAEDTRLKRLVALKTMKPSIASSPDAKSRFMREAQATAALEHDHIVPIYQVGEDRGVPFIAMQFLKGESLAKRLERVKKLSTKEVVRLGKEIALGLACAHEAAMVHRDIKPDNIWLDEKTDRAKILDFGLVSAASADEGLTQFGTVLGTPKYMAPEQALAQPADHRADLFSLGSVLYHAAAGEPPFAGNNFTSTLIAVANQQPRSLQQAAPELHPEVASAIMRLLEKDPDKRSQSAAEVAQQFADLEQFLKRVHTQKSADDPLSDSVSYTHPAPSPVLPPNKPPRRRLLLAGAGGVAALLFGILVITIRDKDGKETTVRAPSGIEVDVDAQPGSKVTIREQEASTPQPMATPVAVLSSDGWHGWPADAPKPAIAPFDAAQAKQHQEEWAAYLKVPVEYTNSIGMKFRLIPPGEFMMGSTQEEITAALEDPSKSEHFQDVIQSEAPKHKVILTQAIYLGANEVTQAEYEKVMGTNPSHLSAMGSGKGAVLGINISRHPIETVSWNDAAEFCAKLSGVENLNPSYFRAGETITVMAGTGYRLPTEAEWEFACRAGTATKYWIGDEDDQLVQVAWVGRNSGGRTHVVRELRANPLGLYDIHGNVFEWVEDAWEPTYYGQFADKFAIDPRCQPFAGSRRVLRGGDWHEPASYSRSSYRSAYDPSVRGLSFGFRVSISVDAIREALDHAMATNSQSIKPEIPTLKPADTLDFALERKIAERLKRLGKGRYVLGNKDRQPVPDWKLENLPSEPLCILEADLAGTELTDDEIVALKGCQALRRLDVSNNPALSDSGFERLGVFPMLTSLNVSQSGVGKKFISWLANTPELETIDLSGTKLEAGAMEVLPKLKSLHTLRLPNTISVDDLKRIGERAPYLRELDAVIDDPAAIVSLAGRPHLVKLTLAGSAVTAGTIKSLQSMPHLESLVIHQPISEAVALLPQLDPKLVSLELVQNGDVSELSSSDLKPLATMKQLVHLSLQGTLPIDKSILDEIATMKWLRSFTIDEASDEVRQAFRQQRPDLEFIVSETHYPALDDWPGKFEGSASIVAWELPDDAPQPAVYPFSPEDATKHQQAWAKFLSVPVESENSLGMKFRLIPPGELVVDTPQSDWSPDRVALEHVDKAFELGTTEVTVAQFEAFVNATGYKTEAERTGTGWSLKDGGWAARPEVTWRTPGYEVKPNLPVTVVSPSDAKALCHWLSEKEGVTYRLPTTQEWYLAGRGGGMKRFGWCTDAEVLEFDWFQENLPEGVLGAQVVDAKRANPFGLQGIIGNVFEFNAGTQVTAFRVGTSWAHSAGNVSYGFTATPIFGAASDTGFRVVRDQSQKPTTQRPVVLVRRGAPLSSTAMVQRPTPIPGVRSWSVEFAGQRGDACNVDWNASGDLIATNEGSNNRTVKLWNKDGTLAAILLGHEGTVTDVSFSPDGKRLATGCMGYGYYENNQIRIWDVASGRCERSITVPRWVWDLVWSPDGRYIAAGGAAEQCLFVDVETGGRVFLSLPAKTEIDTGQLAFNVAGDRLYVVTNQNSIATYSVPSGKLLDSLDADSIVDGQRAADRIDVSPDGKWLAGGTSDGRIRFWDLATDKFSHEVDVKMSHMRQLIWSPDGESIAITGIATDGNHKILRNVDKEVISLRTVESDELVAWSPDNRELVYVNRNASRLEFINVVENSLRVGTSVRAWSHRCFILDDKRIQIGPREFELSTGVLKRQDKSAAGSLLCIAPDKSWKAYRVGSELHVVPLALDRDTVILKPRKMTNTWRAHPQSNVIANANDNFVQLWNAVSGEQLAALPHAATVFDLQWSHDGNEIATLADDQVIRVWDANEKVVIEEYSQLPGDVYPRKGWEGLPAMAWASDKEQWLLASGQHLTRQYRGKTHADTLFNLSGFSPRNGLDSVVLSPNQKRVYVHEIEGSAHVVNDLQNAEEIGFGTGWDASWHPDSRRLLYENLGIVRAYDTVARQWLGTLLPELSDGGWLVIGPTGHCRGSKGVAEHVVYVAQLDDGSNIALSPQEFAKRFGWKNDPEKATLMQYDE